MSTIQAIETHYNGYRFRSRLEARWAVFFDALEIAWSYEVEGLRVTHSGKKTIYYLPDFWLPDWGLFVEIKPTYDIEKTELYKMVSVVAHSESQVELLILRGPDPGQYLGSLFYSVKQEYYHVIEGLQWSECLFCGKPGFYQMVRDGGTIPIDKERFRCNTNGCAASGIGVTLKKQVNWITSGIERAIVAARSARFEHGETPRVPRGKPRK